MKSVMKSRILQALASRARVARVLAAVVVAGCSQQLVAGARARRHRVSHRLADYGDHSGDRNATVHSRGKERCRRCPRRHSHLVYRFRWGHDHASGTVYGGHATRDHRHRGHV